MSTGEIILIYLILSKQLHKIYLHNYKNKLFIFYSSDSDSVQDECLIDGICVCCCYGMASGVRVTVEFFNDGFLDVWLFMTRVGICEPVPLMWKK